VRLDHIALATRDAGPALDVLVGQLGGTVLSGGLAIGYRPMQVHLGTATEGMKVELLEPWRAEENDFLERFVTRHGEGPHHLTFKVDDLEATLDRVSAAGITPVGVDLSFSIWKEAFLQPRDAHGTVVQLAESSSPEKTALEEYAAAERLGIQLMGEKWWPDPPPRAADVTVLRRVVMSSPSVPDALELFVGLLDGTPGAQGDGWVELSWPGGGRIRFEPRADRPAGIDRLEADRTGPARELVVAGARLSVGAPG
jgi:catechol 2,3-dioxygenase-like lactoylglutathione lyase family enzyme